MEAPYGGLWYAAGNPDGFRFETVDRPSPPLSIYRVIAEHQSVKRQTECLKTGRPLTTHSLAHAPISSSDAHLLRLSKDLPVTVLS